MDRFKKELPKQILKGEVKKEHPYIVKVNGICGGRPIIKGTRITVRVIVNLLRQGCSHEEIIATYPHLKPAAIYDALSYHFDHQEEIEAEESFETLMQKYNFEVGEKGLIKFRS
jgi:uncharacterized protein (DUF433 family)